MTHHTSSAGIQERTGCHALSGLARGSRGVGKAWWWPDSLERGDWSALLCSPAMRERGLLPAPAADRA